MAERAPTPPRHLREATASWWRSVVAEYDLEEHHRHLLTLAAEAFDRAEEAREQLDRDAEQARRTYDHPALAMPDDDDVRRWLQPHIRSEAIQGWDDEEAFPALRRAALSLSDNDAIGLTT